MRPEGTEECDSRHGGTRTRHPPTWLGDMDSTRRLVGGATGTGAAVVTMAGWVLGEEVPRAVTALRLKKYSVSPRSAGTVRHKDGGTGDTRTATKGGCRASARARGCSHVGMGAAACARRPPPPPLPPLPLPPPTSSTSPASKVMPSWELCTRHCITGPPEAVHSPGQHSPTLEGPTDVTDGVGGAPVGGVAGPVVNAVALGRDGPVPPAFTHATSTLCVQRATRPPTATCTTPVPRAR